MNDREKNVNNDAVIDLSSSVFYAILHRRNIFHKSVAVVTKLKINSLAFDFGVPIYSSNQSDKVYKSNSVAEKKSRTRNEIESNMDIEIYLPFVQ